MTEQINYHTLDHDTLNANTLFTDYGAQTIVDMLNGINIAAHVCNNEAVTAGWWEMGAKNRNKGEQLALIHSEISEALEGARKGICDDHLPKRLMEEVELADALIRIFDYAMGHNLDGAGALVEKLQYNRDRADHKRENRAKEGGKKF